MSLQSISCIDRSVNVISTIVVSVERSEVFKPISCIDRSVNVIFTTVVSVERSKVFTVYILYRQKCQCHIHNSRQCRGARSLQSISCIDRSVNVIFTTVVSVERSKVFTAYLLYRQKCQCHIHNSRQCRGAMSLQPISCIDRSVNVIFTTVVGVERAMSLQSISCIDRSVNVIFTTVVSVERSKVFTAYLLYRQKCQCHIHNSRQCREEQGLYSLSLV